MTKFFGILMMVLLFNASLPAVATAQEKQESTAVAAGKTTYSGSLQGNCTGLRNRPVTVEISGETVNGSWTNAAGSTSRFEGKMKGDSSVIDRPGVRGETARIKIDRVGDALKFSHSQTNCSYTSTLKKQSS